MMKRWILTWVCGTAGIAAAVEPCRIEVVEEGSGWPIPLVELRTTHQVRLVTDNAGLIALDLPELMGREIWFDVIGHGYGRPADGFGYRGVRLTPEPGETRRVELRRTIIARRLGRLTGAGLFAERAKLQPDIPLRETGVFGADSVQVAVHRGRLFWLWGDTTLPHYPLGIFDSSSATTPLHPLASPEPPIHIAFEYFRADNGRPRGVAPIPGSGPTWLTGYVSLPDADGASRLVATYTKITPPLEPYETGLCVWNDETETFEHLDTLWSQSADEPKPPPLPSGHPVRWEDPTGQAWILFGDPFPRLRCPATFEAWQDPTQWEILSPQPELRSASDDASVRPHSGSIAFHPWRKRWVTVFMQHFGSPSVFGELWYAEADSPMGPWGPAVKVLSHQNYTFYNPRLHPQWSSPDSPILLFEGTYTMQFADHPPPTPRDDYNQILYRLDLDDPQLAPAQH